MHSFTSYSILTSTWYWYDPQSAVFHGQYCTTKRPIERDKNTEKFKHYQTCPANQTVQWFFSQSFGCLLPRWYSQKHSQFQAEIQSFLPCRHQILPSCSTSLHSAIQIFLSCGSVTKKNGQIQKKTKSPPVDQVPNYLDAKLLNNQLGNLVPYGYWEVLAGPRCDVLPAGLASENLDPLSDWYWRIARSSGPWLKRTTPT